MCNRSSTKAKSRSAAGAGASSVEAERASASEQLAQAEAAGRALREENELAQKAFEEAQSRLEAQAQVKHPHFNARIVLGRI